MTGVMDVTCGWPPGWLSVTDAGCRWALCGRIGGVLLRFRIGWRPGWRREGSRAARHRAFQVAMTQPVVVRDRPAAVSCRRLIPAARSLSQASFLVTPI